MLRVDVTDLTIAMEEIFSKVTNEEDFGALEMCLRDFLDQALESKAFRLGIKDYSV